MKIKVGDILVFNHPVCDWRRAKWEHREHLIVTEAKPGNYWVKRSSGRKFDNKWMIRDGGKEANVDRQFVLPQPFLSAVKEALES